MILTFHEGACVRAQAGDTTLVFGPVSKGSKNFKPVNFGADVIFVSLNHPDMNGGEDVRRPRLESSASNGASNQPFVISGAGEYEVKDMTAAGFPSGSFYDGSPASAKASAGTARTNTIYSVHFDGLSVMYLGALGDLDLPAEVQEMDSPDVLIIPVGGAGALTPAEAQKLAVKLEAKIVIPILYDLPTGQAGAKSLKQFLKEAGEEDTKPVEKLTIKPKDVAGKESEVIVLSS